MKDLWRQLLGYSAWGMQLACMDHLLLETAKMCSREKSRPHEDAIDSMGLKDGLFRAFADLDKDRSLSDKRVSGFRGTAFFGNSCLDLHPECAELPSAPRQLCPLLEPSAVLRPSCGTEGHDFGAEELQLRVLNRVTHDLPRLRSEPFLPE